MKRSSKKRVVIPPFEGRPNPFLDDRGYPLPGQGPNARAFAKAEHQREQDSLTPEQLEEFDRQHRNFVNHMNIAV